MNTKNTKHNNIDVNSLTDIELKQKTMDMNQSQLFIVRDMSYYYLIQKTAELIKLLDDKELLNEYNIGNEKDIIINICNRIVNSFLKYNSSSEIKVDENEVEELLSMREQLYNLLSALYGYGVEASYIRELSEYSIIKDSWENQYSNYDIRREEIDSIINKINIKLNEFRNDYNSYVNTISYVISVVPFRMSKLKYFDIVKFTLNRNFSDLSINIVEKDIERFKMSFDSTLLGDYGVLFDSYFIEIQRFKNIHLDRKSTDELRSITEEISNLENKIIELSSFINNLGILVNRLIVLNRTKKNIEITSTIKDDYKKWTLYLESKDEKQLESLISNSDKKLENKEKELMDKIEDFNVLITEIANRNLNSSDDERAELSNTREILSLYNDVNLTKYETLFPEDEKYQPIDDDYLSQVLENLIQYINRSISSMTGTERKIRMRRLLSMLELPFKDIDEFFDYIVDSLDEKLVSKGEIRFTLDTLNHILNEHM